MLGDIHGCICFEHFKSCCLNRQQHYERGEHRLSGPKWENMILKWDELALIGTHIGYQLG